MMETYYDKKLIAMYINSDYIILFILQNVQIIGL